MEVEKPFIWIARANFKTHSDVNDIENYELMTRVEKQGLNRGKQRDICQT